MTIERSPVTENKDSRVNKLAVTSAALATGVVCIAGTAVFMAAGSEGRGSSYVAAGTNGAGGGKEPQPTASSQSVTPSAEAQDSPSPSSLACDKVYAGTWKRTRTDIGTQLVTYIWPADAKIGDNPNMWVTTLTPFQTSDPSRMPGQVAMEQLVSPFHDGQKPALETISSPDSTTTIQLYVANLGNRVKPDQDGEALVSVSDMELTACPPLAVDGAGVRTALRAPDGTISQQSDFDGSGTYNSAIKVPTVITGCNSTVRATDNGSGCLVQAK